MAKKPLSLEFRAISLSYPSSSRDDADINVIGTHLMHQLLAENGATFDLVYLMKGGGDYRSTYRNNLISILRTSGLEGRLSARGGIHLETYLRMAPKQSAPSRRGS